MDKESLDHIMSYSYSRQENAVVHWDKAVLRRALKERLSLDELRVKQFKLTFW